jgi:hypothetical protein
MMRKGLLLIVVGLVLACAAPAFTQKNKVKNKEKRFETVVKQNVADYAGRYSGFQSDYYLEIRVDGAGALSATSFEGERRAELQNIRLEQGHLTATRVYEDGATKEFAATFANRILNGTSDFGLLIEGAITLTPSMIVNRVFYKRE